jgi:hypothetical protein
MKALKFQLSTKARTVKEKIFRSFLKNIGIFGNEKSKNSKIIYSPILKIDVLPVDLTSHDSRS